MQNNTIDNKITIDEIRNLFDKILKEAKNNSFKFKIGYKRLRKLKILNK